MGFLDRVKGIVDQATGSGAVPPTSDPSSGPATTTTEAPLGVTDVTDILGTAAEPAGSGADGSSRWWRYTVAGAGPLTIEVHEADEDAIGRHGGSPAAFAADRLGGCAERGTIPDPHDYDGSAWGRLAPDRVETWVWLADSCFGIVLDGPIDDPVRSADQLARRIYGFG